MAKVRPIPIPLSQHWRRIRYQFMPVMVFVAASVLSVWLWRQQAGITSGLGEAEVLSTNLTAPASGILIPINRQWQTFRHVLTTLDG